MAFLVSILLVLVASTDNLVFGGLETLGSDISASVQASLAPLENLGARINEEVQRGLKPVRDLAPLQNLGSRINEEVQQSLKSVRDLEGLGARINQQVEKDLEPVRALELKLKMQRGVGGVTIATYQPEGKQFIIKNSRSYICDGTIDLTSGDCSGTLQPFKITASSPKPAWCYVENFVWVNDNLCLSTGPISVQIINGFSECSGRSPILQLSQDEYKDLCNSHNQKVEYRYIPDLNSHKRVDIPNKNKYVKCDNQEGNLCVFSENPINLSSSHIIVNY